MTDNEKKLRALLEKCRDALAVLPLSALGVKDFHGAGEHPAEVFIRDMLLDEINDVLGGSCMDSETVVISIPEKHRHSDEWARTDGQCAATNALLAMHPDAIVVPGQNMATLADVDLERGEALYHCAFRLPVKRPAGEGREGVTRP